MTTRSRTWAVVRAVESTSQFAVDAAWAAPRSRGYEREEPRPRERKRMVDATTSDRQGGGAPSTARASFG